MSEESIYDAMVMEGQGEEPRALARVEESTDLYRAPSPEETVARASAQATVLTRVIEDQKLYSTISGRRHVKVEGWTTVAALNGVVPREVGRPQRQEDGSYYAVVELIRVADGSVVGRASSLCGGPDEPMWAGRPEYARASMAVTRATGKACRMLFSWIVTLSGFDATPAEEMPREEPNYGQDPRRSAPPEPAYPAHVTTTTAPPIPEDMPTHVPCPTFKFGQFYDKEARVGRPISDAWSEPRQRDYLGKYISWIKQHIADPERSNFRDRNQSHLDEIEAWVREQNGGASWLQTV